jgi:hypothetical protein
MSPFSRDKARINPALRTGAGRHFNIHFPDVDPDWNQADSAASGNVCRRHPAGSFSARC